MTDVLLGLWKEYLGPILGPLVSSVGFLQAAVLILLTILVLLILYRRQLADLITDTASREHDVALFKKGNDIIDEPRLDDLLNLQFFNHRCERDSLARMQQFRHDFQREENQFLDRQVKQATHDLIGGLTRLDTFAAKHFFTSPTGDDTYRLYPEMRDHQDPDMRARYWDRVPQLNELCEAAWAAYRKYRATVKMRLRV